MVPMGFPMLYHHFYHFPVAFLREFIVVKPSSLLSLSFRSSAPKGMQGRCHRRRDVLGLGLPLATTACCDLEKIYLEIVL